MQDLKTIFGEQIYLKSLSSKNNVEYLLCVIDVFTKYAWVKTLKNKKGRNSSIGIVNESKCKPSKLQVDQGSEFCNKLTQEWLDNKDILRYSTHNEDKS